jgi:hypothetical protein
VNIFLTAAKEIVLKKEEKRLIEIIRDVLAGKNKSEWSMQISKEEIERVIKCARVHGVLPFLQECPVFMEEPYREKLFFYLKDYAYKDAQQAYAAETLFELFEKNGIYCMPYGQSSFIRTRNFVRWEIWIFYIKKIRQRN